MAAVGTARLHEWLPGNLLVTSQLEAHLINKLLCHVVFNSCSKKCYIVSVSMDKNVVMKSRIIITEKHKIKSMIQLLNHIKRASINNYCEK